MTFYLKWAVVAADMNDVIVTGLSFPKSGLSPASSLAMLVTFYLEWAGAADSKDFIVACLVTEFV